MPRIARLVVKGEPAVYHVISRTALDGFVINGKQGYKRLNMLQSDSQHLRFGDIWEHAFELEAIGRRAEQSAQGKIFRWTSI